METIKNLNLPLHKLIASLQNENGLKHNDFRRYRHFLTRKLQTTRRRLPPVPSQVSSGGKNSKDRFNYKGQQTFSPEALNDSSYLLILLLTAERAWSYANEKKHAFSQNKKSSLTI